MLLAVRLERVLPDKAVIRNRYNLVKDDVFLSVTQAHTRIKKKIPGAPNRSRTYDLQISTSDALPLSYRRLVVARPLN